MLGLSIETLRIDFRDVVAYGSLTQSYLSYIPDIPIHTSHRWGIPMETQLDPRNGGHQIPLRKVAYGLRMLQGYYGLIAGEALKFTAKHGKPLR